MHRTVLALLTLLPALGACGAEEGPAKGGTLKIGVILPMTGGQATYGEESWNGLLLAEEELRKAGAPAFRLFKEDEKSSKQEAGSRAKSLIDSEKVHGLIGSVASSITKQIAQEAKEAGVPLITPASTNDTVTTEGGPYVSRICFKDSFQGPILAKFALDKGWKRAAAVVDKANAYSTGLAKSFDEAYQKDGGTITYDYFSEGDNEFSNIVDSVVARKPDVIFVSGYYTEGGKMIKQASGKWDGLPAIAGDGFDSPKLISLIGDTKVRIFFSTHFAADAPDAAVQGFAKRYEERFGEPPGAMAALGYDVLFVFMDAVKRAKDPFDRASLAQAIRETKGVKGVTGVIDLTTPDRTPLKDLVIVRVDGTFKYEASYSPNS
jgi:branched-chain amino acid transport system substrate-binding protein